VTAATAILPLLAALVLGGVVSFAVRALRYFSPHELEALCRKRDAEDLLRRILHWHERVLLVIEGVEVILVSTTAVLAAYWTWLWTNPVETAAWLQLVAAGLFWTSMILVAMVWVPRAAANHWAESFLFRTWHVWRLVSRALWPLAIVANSFETVFRLLTRDGRRSSNEQAFEDELLSVVTEGHHEGLLEEDAREMIEGVVDLADTSVSEIMTPRTSMVCMPLDTQWKQVVDFVSNQAHSRIPVFGKNRDDIVGILYARDLIPELALDPDESPRALQSILRKPKFVPETKQVVSLLEQFQRTHNHLAVVLDEYGGVSGLVTIEDVLEEIVGEIVDEFDEDETDRVQQLDAKSADVDAAVHIDELNELLGLDLPEQGDFDTVGGFVFSALGHVPGVGETLLRDNVRITVLKVTRRRIERVRVELVDSIKRETA